MSWFGIADKAADIVDQLVTDKDLAAKLKVEMHRIEAETYQRELSTHTIPWVDALHKMYRPLMGVAHFVVCCVIIYYHPDINPMTLGALNSVGLAYTIMKGKGKAFS